MLNEKVKQDFLKDFGENVRKIRKKKKMTQLELAARINGDEMKISRIERGLYNFGVSSILILAKALEVEVCDLWDIKQLDFYSKRIWVNPGD